MPPTPTALIVEDEPTANALLARLVQLKGYLTDSAFTGGEALEKIRLHAPDIVFLDLMLPDIDGYQVCRAVKAAPETSLVPIVLVTAGLVAENRRQGYRAGADDYIPKPYLPQQIFEAMSEVNAWRKSADAPSPIGRFVMDLNDEDNLDRNLSRLHNLLVARTPLDLPVIDQIVQIPRALFKELKIFSYPLQSRQPATLEYRVETDRLVLTVHDQTGWIKDGLLNHEDMRDFVTNPQVFDERIISPDASSIIFAKRFTP